MTVENRTIISLSDIVGIEYVCAKCATRYMVPVGSFESSISACPNCKNEIIGSRHDHGGPAETSAVYDFVVALKEVIARSTKIRLEISSEVRASGSKG